MAETAVQQDAPAKRSKLPLILGIVAAVVLGAGGFYATWSGMVSLPQSHAKADLPPVAFVPLDPMVISLGDSGTRQHLRFSAQLETAPDHQAEVDLLKPRILDVLNGYLRAVSVHDLDSPAQLVRLRAQMLRRIQMVTGEGRVHDLLITEFVPN